MKTIYFTTLSFTDLYDHQVNKELNIFLFTWLSKTYVKLEVVKCIVFIHSYSWIYIHDGAEVCELIGIFMLWLLSKHINKSHIGLYRDDCLAILKNTGGPEAEKLEKKRHKLFKEKDVDIIIECNLKITNYLNITLNLNNGSCHPYRKSNEETNYIHINSDNQPSIIKEIPWSIEKRLSILSSSKDIFQESAIYYEKCLKTVDIKPSYNINNQKKTIKTKRKENVTLFGSIHHTASPLKPISGEYSSN